MRPAGERQRVRGIRGGGKCRPYTQGRSPYSMGGGRAEGGSFQVEWQSPPTHPGDINTAQKCRSKRGWRQLSPSSEPQSGKQNPPYSPQDTRVRVRCRPVWGQSPKPGTSLHRQCQQRPPRPKTPPQLIEPHQAQSVPVARGTIPHPPAVRGRHRGAAKELRFPRRTSRQSATGTGFRAGPPG